MNALLPVLPVLLATALAKPWVLRPPAPPADCTPQNIQNLVLCGCHLAEPLLPASSTDRCMSLFRVDHQHMASSCTPYTESHTVPTENLLRNLRYIRDNCHRVTPRRRSPAVDRQMLTPEEVDAILAEIQDMILEILNSLNPGGPSVAPGQRFVVGGSAKERKVARLAFYNGIAL